MGLSASVAMLNHRCDPNADWSLDASGGPAGPNASPSRARARQWRIPRAQLAALDCSTLPWGEAAHRGAQLLPRGLELTASVAADATPFDHPGCLVVRALRPIRSGEELCLSYVETSLPTAERKAHLLTHFGFECGCARCATE